MKNFTLITLCILMQVALSGQRNMTLEDCLKQVVEATPESRQRAINEALRIGQHRVNNTNYMPQLSLNAKATWQSDVTHVDVPLPGVEIASPDKDQYAFTADLVQPIYQGGAFHAHDHLIEQESRVADINTEINVQTLLERTVNLYYQAMMQKQLITSQNILIEQFSTLQNTMQHRYENGIVDKQAVLDTHLKIKSAQQTRTEAQTQYEIARASLAVLLQIDSAAFRLLPPPGEITEVMPGTVSGRPELRLQEARAEVNAAQDAYNRTQYRPKLSLFASLGYGKPGLNFLNNAFDTYAIAGATAQIPISQLYSGKGSKERQLYALQSDAILLSQEQAERELEIKALQYKNDIGKFRSWIVDDIESIALLEEVVRISEAKQTGGTITVTDYLDKLTELALARDKKIVHEIGLRRTQELLRLLYNSNQYHQ